METLRKKALGLGADEFGRSAVRGKRFYVIYKGKKINFGSDVGSTFIDHRDKRKQRAWKARHSKIKLANGRLAYKTKISPAYWSWRLTWD